MNTLLKGCIAAMTLLCLIFTGCVTNSEVEEEAKAPNIHEYFELDQEPEPLNMREVQMSIGYPKEAMDNNIQGVVVMRVLVGEEGEYVKHEVVKEESPILMEAINEKIENLKFTPGIKEGASVSAWVNIPFKFKMIEEEKDPAIDKALNYFKVSEKIGYPSVEGGPQVEGRVLLRIQVDAEGNYLSHEVLEEGHPVLLKGVEPYVHELVFLPNPEGENYSVDLPFEYRLLKAN
ncbi:MAG: energy transducer TonB [Bacteroidota bacterium]